MASFTGKGIGLHTVQQVFNQKGDGLSRVANDALDQYELYIGSGGLAPDYGAPPAETFAALPHTSAAFAVDDVYLVTTRKRNKWNQVSENIDTFRLEIDGGGGQIVRPSEAEQISVVPSAAGAVRVRAHYFYRPDAPLSADNFLIYLRSDGSDPDPDLDIPAVVEMKQVDGASFLDYTSAPMADGLDVRIIVRTRRAAAPAADSLDLTVYSTVSDIDGPAAVGGGAFFGVIAEQKQ